jgi:hypothetical protein
LPTAKHVVNFQVNFLPFEGMPASLGPGLRTASGAQRDLGEYSHRFSFLPMAEQHRKGQKTQLTVALAQGISAAKWARINEVPIATAYRWSKEPAVQAQIESIRRRAIDRAVGRMARRMTWATEGIAKLAKNAKSESVQLLALRSILTDMRAFSEFLGRAQRGTDTNSDIEERHHDHSAPTTSMG